MLNGRWDDRGWSLGVTRCVSLILFLCSCVMELDFEWSLVYLKGGRRGGKEGGAMWEGIGEFCFALLCFACIEIDTVFEHLPTCLMITVSGLSKCEILMKKRGCALPILVCRWKPAAAR